MVNFNAGCGFDSWGDVRLDPDVGSSLNVLGVVEALPFRDHVFHRIKFSHVWEHTRSPLISLKELMRVLNGKMLISIPNVYYYLRVLRTLKRGIGIPVSLGITHYQTWDLITLKEIFFICGIKSYRIFFSWFRYEIEVLIDG